MLQIGLIGYGAIGQAVHELLLAHARDSVELVGILVPASASVQPRPQTTPPVVAHSLDAFLAAGLDLVVECAGHGAVDEYAASILDAGLDMVLVSVGALADASRERRLREKATATRRQLLLPAGAIGCIDWLGAARTAGLTQVHYRSRKPPQAWIGSPAEQAVDLTSLTTATVFFRGSAREAATCYPRNANVAATVALAGLGLDATQVEMIADPETDANVHEIEAVSAGGKMMTRMTGQPDPSNPRTSVLTAHSVLRTIQHRSAAMVI